MIVHHTKKNLQEKTIQHDLSEGYDIAFTVLYREDSAFKRADATGKVLHVDGSVIEISTSFPLRANQVLYWADRHKKDHFHLAMVKWSGKSDDFCRVGLSMLA